MRNRTLREKEKSRENSRFHRLVKEIDREGKLQKMRAYIQHGDVTTYDHALHVARLSFGMNRRLHIRAKERDLVRGALLHDYFLYDWHAWKGPLHGYYHPKAAVENAKRDFKINRREENIIRSHMWPLTFFHVPRSREAVIVCVADKICSARETLFMRKKKHTEKSPL